MKELDWNRERYRTRDRLIEYKIDVMSPQPYTRGITSIYPWETYTLKDLEKEIFLIAQKNGYNGTKELLWSKFNGGTIISGTLNTFPTIGEINNLYLDIDTGILYYFKMAYGTIKPSLLARIGAAIVGTSVISGEEINYIYVPIHALLIENELLNS